VPRPLTRGALRQEAGTLEGVAEEVGGDPGQQVCPHHLGLEEEESILHGKREGWPGCTGRQSCLLTQKVEQQWLKAHDQGHPDLVLSDSAIRCGSLCKRLHQSLLFIYLLT
jgi:hypothetical protein